MLLLVTVHTILYHLDGNYYANMVYGYDFFARYLNVFDEIRVVAFSKESNSEETKGMLLVNGDGVSIYPISYSRSIINRLAQLVFSSGVLKKATENIDAAVLRVPEQLPFQLYNILKKRHIPIAVEVVVDPWNYFANKNGRTIWQFVRRYVWTAKQKKVCREAIGAAYVTKNSLQEIYPPRALFDSEAFTTSYTSAEILPEWYTKPREKIEHEVVKIIHVSTNLDNNGKGYIELLKSLAGILKEGHNVELTLVGGGYLKDDVKSIIKSNNLENYIRYTGKIAEKSKLREEYINADIMIFPTYGEGLPRTIIEAMGTGLVCISTKVNGVVELLDEGDLVDVGEVNQIVRLFGEYISSPIKYKESSKRNYEKALEYSKENTEVLRTTFYKQLREIASKE